MSIEKYVKNICINAKTASKQISCIDENAKSYTKFYMFVPLTN